MDAFVEPPPAPIPTADEECCLGLLAWGGLYEHLRDPRPAPAGEGDESLAPRLTAAVEAFLEARGGGGLLLEERGVFVTILRDEALRGCLGAVEGREPLWRAVARLARAAAGSDRRFPPVERSELPALRLEITCLGAPTALPTDPRVLLAGLRPERHGVWLRSAGKTGLLLPQVAKRCGWTAGELLEQVSLKAGLEESAWRGPGAQLAAFTAHSFAVERPSAAVFAPGGEESSDAPGAPR